MKGGGSSISLVHFFGVFLEGFVFPFFVFEGGEWGGSDFKASLKVTLQKFEITFKLDLHLGS